MVPTVEPPMQHDRLAILVVLVSLTAMTLLGVAVVSPIGAQSPDDIADRTISVDATGGADAAPDRAIVRVSATAEGDDPSAVRDSLATDADALRSNLDDAGVARDSYETSRYRISERRRPPREKREVASYRGVHTFEVTLEDPDRVGTVIDAAADSDAEIEHVEFTLSEAVREELREEAIENAMGDARSQAGTIATSGDLHVTSIATVDARQQRFRPVSYEMEASAAGGDAGGTRIETGDVSVQYAVEVTYNATAK
jgi:uncharacterized protein YggE